MSPRRKKAEAEGTEASVEGAEVPTPTPKKTRATHKKAPAKKVEVDVAVPKQETPPPAPAPAPEAPAMPKPPVNIPIKPIPPIAVPPRMVIEPEAHGANAIEDLWKPNPREDASLSKPPQVLLQRKKVQKQEVEDILEEPREARYGIERESLRPVVRTGMYRKIALGFAVLAALVGALAMYVVYAHATVTVHPQRAELRTEQDLTVSADPRDGDVPGQIAELTVSGDRTEAPGESTSIDGVAGGEVTLINETGEDQVLIPTTRLLTSDGVLFRIKSRVNVPAHGKIKTDAYADKPGADGDIGPSKFTIPGLSADLQKVIYALSDSAMTGGTVSSGVISQDDIEKAENGLRDELTQQAKGELAKTIDPKWSGQAFVVETMSRSVSAAIGETAPGVTVRLTLRVREAGFDKDKALALAMEDLKRGLTSERELLGADLNHAEFSLSSADPKTSTASLRISLKGQSQVSLSGPSFDPANLKGKSLSDVQDYFSGVEGVQKVDVVFNPFWIKRMPDLADHIKISIQK